MSEVIETVIKDPVFIFILHDIFIALVAETETGW